jgi:hypothetical protein
MKFKVEIELDLDFEDIFSKIPEDVYYKKRESLGEDYYVQTISRLLSSIEVNSVIKDIKDMADYKDLYKYIRHHNHCEIQCAMEIARKAKIKIVK